MNETRKYQGSRGEYSLAEPSPFAHGRISALFRARDGAGNIVCLKEFTQSPVNESGREGTAEFLAELATRERVAHPNILPILDHGSFNQRGMTTPFIVMPFCEHDLRVGMRGRAFIPLAETLAVLKQVAAAIDFAHGAGLIHGDIKPENILFQKARAHVFLSDFGTAKFFAFSEAVVTNVQSLPRGGSTAYLSPEQVGDNQQTARSDIYAFAAVAFEMLAGKMPIDPASSMFKQMQDKVAGRHRNARDLNPTLSEAVAQWLEAGLSATPKARPPTALALCAGLESGAPPSSSKDARSPPADLNSASPAPLSMAGQVPPPATQTVGRTWADLAAGLMSQRIALVLVTVGVVALLMLATFVHRQAAPGSDVKLFGLSWHKAGVAPPSCVALKHLRDLDFGSGNKSRFCAGTLYDAARKFDGVLNMPGAEYQDAWCYSGDLQACKAEVIRREAQAAPPIG